jgi:septum site-determining protein MinC
LDNSVIIKGGKKGITVLLDKNCSFEDLKERLEEKFRDSAKFFKEANLAITFEGRNLTSAQENELVDVIRRVSDFNIVCVINKNNESSRMIEDGISKIVDDAIQSRLDLIDKPCHFYKGTLRSGQVFETEGSAVILGDVNPGGKVIAGDNVVILGSLKGYITAGCNENPGSFVYALEMKPMQIQIGEIIARSQDNEDTIRKGRKTKKDIVIEPKIAYVYDNNIYIEEFSQDVLSDIQF